MLTLCDGMMPISIHSSDPQYQLVHASIRNHDDVEQKYRTVIAAGSLSIGARVELFRQICQSTHATVGERVSAARSLTALCLHSDQHYHLAHRIGLNLSFQQNRSLGDLSVSIATSLYTGAWDVLEALQRHVMPETFGMMASLVRDAEYMRYLASRIPLLGMAGESAGSARQGASARAVDSFQVGPRFAQGFTHRGQSGDAEETLSLGEHGRRWREKGAATELIMVPQVASMTTVTRQDAILRRLAVEHASRAPLPSRGQGEDRLYRRYGSFTNRGHGLGNSPWGGSRLDPIRSLPMASPRLLQLEIDDYRSNGSLLEREASYGVRAGYERPRVSAEAELPMSLSVQRRFEAITGGAQMDRAVLRSEWWRLQITKPRLACELGYIFTGREDWRDAQAGGNATEIRAIDGMQAVPNQGGGGISPSLQAIIRATQCVLSRTASSPWPVMAADGYRRRATTKRPGAVQNRSTSYETRYTEANKQGRRATPAPPLRLAIASGDLGAHAIGFVIPYMLAWMDRRRVHVTVLSTGKEDEANQDRDYLAGEGGADATSMHLTATAGANRATAAKSTSRDARTATPSSLLQRVASTGAVSAAQLHWIQGVAGDEARRMSQSMRLRRAAHRFVGMESVLARFAVDTTDEAFAKREWQRDLLLACYHGNETVARARERGAIKTFPGWSIIPLRLGHLPMRTPASPTRVEDLVLASSEAAGCNPAVSVVVPSVANSDVVALYGVDAPYSGDLFPALPFRRLNSMPANLRSSQCKGRAWMSHCGMDGSAIAVLSQAILSGTLTNPSATDQRLVGHLPALAGVADIMYPVRELLRKHGVLDDVTLRARIEHGLVHAPTDFMSEYLSVPLRFAEYGMAADVLIDLSLVTVPPMGPPMAMRPCRVQAAYLGYASTVDSSQLSYDFWIADAALAPPDELPSFGLGWRHRESLKSGVQKNSRLRWTADGSTDQRRGGEECLTCDVVTITAADSHDEAGPKTDACLRRVQLPADEQTGLGVVYMPHSYHPTGAKYGMPACGLVGSTAVQRARRAIACQDDALLRLLPKFRVWSNAVHRVGVARLFDHMDFVTDPALAHQLRRVALDGGLGERRMQDRTLRNSSPDVGLKRSTVSLGDSAASSMLGRLVQGLTYLTDSVAARGVASTRRPLFVSLPGQTRKTTALLYDAVCTLLRRVPRARLVLKGPQQSESIQRLVAEAAARGIASHRLLFMHGHVSMARYLGRLLAVDMVFDTYPFGTHSLMIPPATLGVPLVVMRGVPHIGRVATGMLRRIDAGLRAGGASRGVAGLLHGRSFRELTAVSERLLGLPLIGRGRVRSYIARESVQSGFLSDALAGQSLSRATQLMWEVRSAQVGNAALGVAGQAVSADGCFETRNSEQDAKRDGTSDKHHSPGIAYPCSMPTFDRVLRIRGLDRPVRSMLLGWIPMHVVVHPESGGRSGSYESKRAARDALRLALDGAALWAGEQASTYWKLGAAAQSDAAASRAGLAG